MANDNFMYGILDDSDEMIYQDVIESHLPCRTHLLITGNLESDNTSKKTTEILEKLVYSYTYEKGDIYRLEVFDKDYIEGSNSSNQSIDFNKTSNKVSEIIKDCLKLFGKINIALVYKDKQEEIIYLYKKRVSNRWTKRDNEKLTKVFRDFYKNIPNDSNWQYKSEMPERYLKPGVENISAILKDETKLSKVLIGLRGKIEKSKSFFQMPFNIESETYHLYHHPKHSFPLPVLLKSPQEEPNYWDFDNWFWEDDNEEKGDAVKPKINNKEYKKVLEELKDQCLLGYYKHDDECGCFGPHIVLFPENIEKTAEKQELKEELVYLIVLIHEMAHAMMDKKRTEGSKRSLFAQAMEESLANRITLEWFKKYEEKSFNQVRKFIENQPTIYNFGIKQHNANVDWTKWCESYKNMHFLLKVWFDTCFLKNVQKNTVRSAYDKVFAFKFDDLIELFENAAVNKLESKSIDSYRNSIKKCDTLNHHMTCDWFAKTIMGKFSDDDDPLSFWEEKIEETFNKSSLNQKTKQNHISGCKKFAQCLLGFYYANIWLLIDRDDSLFCELVAKNALFASKEVVDDVKKGNLGTDDNKSSGNDYASWDHMMRVRITNRSLKNKLISDKNPQTWHLGPTVIGDDNNMANLAIKNAIIESYKRKYRGIIPDISLLRDYEACHIWDYPKDRRYYASIANLILLPRALAKLTDHNDAVKELLRYEVFRRFKFKPDGHADPKRPKNYNKFIWRDQDVL